MASDQDFASLSRTQTISKTRSSGGPSRIKNRRQDKIVEMIDGYDSSITPAAAIRNITLIWLLPAIAWVMLGLVAMAAGSDLGMTSREQFTRSIELGSALLLGVTFIFATVWSVKTYFNIRRLGKKPGIGASTFFKRQLVPIVASSIGAIGYFASETYKSSFLTLLLLGLAGVIPMLSLEGMKMFWRTSGLPTGLEEVLPHAGMFGFGAVIAHLAALRFIVLGREYADLFAESLIMVFAGLSLAAAAYFLAPLFAMVSIRQEDRLAAIISSVDVAEEGSAKPVTNEQISDAWQSSENLVSFDR